MAEDYTVSPWRRRVFSSQMDCLLSTQERKLRHLGESRGTMHGQDRRSIHFGRIPI
jgi:hypothetical protein